MEGTQNKMDTYTGNNFHNDGQTGNNQKFAHNKNN